MKKAKIEDRARIVDILSRSFDTNKSVNFIVKQDGQRAGRIRKLMEYSFDLCFAFGEVFLSDDANACALILKPDLKKTTLQSVLLDVKFATSVCGPENVGKVLSRESKVKAQHPKEPFYYLWFIGVNPEYQRRGIGTALLKEVVNEGQKQGRPVYLETSTQVNIPWYLSMGFETFHEQDYGYRLYFMRRPLT